MTVRPNDDGTSEPPAGGQHPEAAWSAPGSIPTAPSSAGPSLPPAPPAGQPFPGHPFPGQPVAGQPFPGPSVPGQPVAGQPVAGQPKRRAGLIAAASLAIVLLLCGGGGTAAFLLLRDAESGQGAPEPVAAVDAFLEAVYTEQDTARATAMVCIEARDEAAIAEKVREVKEYSTSYVEPRFDWDPPTVATQNEERAIVSVKLTMTTGDEKVSDQQLRFTVVRKTGWWICEVG